MDPHAEVVYPDGTAELFRLTGERPTLGRSPAVAVPLPDVRELEPEHVALVPQQDGCWVAAARAAAVPVELNGAPLKPGIVPWGSELRIGPVRVRVHRERPVPGTASPFRRPVTWVVLIGGLVIIFTFLHGGPPPVQTEAGVPPPELLDPAPAACPADRGRELRVATRAASEGMAKAERYPFDAQDGIEAAHAYNRASVCYRAIGEGQLAGDMERAARELSGRLEEDYRAHRLRLELSLSQQRWNDALGDAQALAAILAHREGPYVEWLATVTRQLRLRVD